MSKENKGARELKFNSECGVWLDKSTAMEVEIFFPEHSHYNNADLNEHFIKYSAYQTLEQRLAEAVELIDECADHFYSQDDADEWWVKHYSAKMLDKLKKFKASLADGSDK